jgi:hypothetical protein
MPEMWAAAERRLACVRHASCCMSGAPVRRCLETRRGGGQLTVELCDRQCQHQAGRIASRCRTARAHAGVAVSMIESIGRCRRWSCRPRSVYNKGVAACAVDAYLTHRVLALGHVMQITLCVRWHRSCHHVTIHATSSTRSLSRLRRRSSIHSPRSSGERR